MSLQLNSVNGSVTLVPEDGAGNVNVTVPRGGLGGIIYDLSAATADQVLNVGDKAVYNFAAAVSIPLHIATGSGQKYRITLATNTAAATTIGSVWLLPNNTTYTNAFANNWLYTSNTTVIGSTSNASGIYLSFANTRGMGITDLDTTTTSKVYLMTSAMDDSAANYVSVAGGVWDDSTTIWASLGTVQMDAGAETLDGNILVERIL